MENRRILKDKATTQITKDNLPALEEEAVPSALWLQKKLEIINAKPTKNLSDILTAHLKNRLDPRLSTVFTAPPTRAPETITTSLRKFKNSVASSALNMLKLNASSAEERILNTAKKFIEGDNPSLIMLINNAGSEIKRRNQAANSHLDNKLLRLRHKLKYNALLTNEKLKEWKIIESEACSFCGIAKEDIVHLLNDCEVFKTAVEYDGGKSI